MGSTLARATPGRDRECRVGPAAEQGHCPAVESGAVIADKSAAAKRGRVLTVSLGGSDVARDALILQFRIWRLSCIAAARSPAEASGR